MWRTRDTLDFAVYHTVPRARRLLIELVAGDSPGRGGWPLRGAPMPAVRAVPRVQRAP